MTWNYRLFEQDTPDAVEDQLFFVAECFYDDNGNPEMHSTMEHNHISGDSAKDTEETYKMIGEAFKQPPIKLDKEGNFKDQKIDEVQPNE